MLLAAVLMIFFLKGVSWSDVWQSINGVHLGYVIAFALGILIQYGIKAYRWGVILRSQPARIPFETLYHFISFSFFLNTVMPGKLGEPAKGVLVARRHNFSEGAGLASVVIERLIDLLMLLVLFMVSFLLYPVGDNPLLMKIQRLAWLAAPLILGLFLLFFLINRQGLNDTVRRWLERIVMIVPSRMRQRVLDFLVAFIENLHISLSFGDMLRLLISSVLVWVSILPFFWLLMQGFDWGRSIGLLETVPYFALLMVGAAIPTPGMAGSLDSASKIGFYQLMGIAPEYSGSVVAYTLLFHTILLLLALLAGLVAVRRLKIGLSTLKGVKKNEMS